MNHRIEMNEFFDEDEVKHTSKRVLEAEARRILRKELELNYLLEAEARRILRKELELNYQTQGYETNYDIEVWNINEWCLT